MYTYTNFVGYKSSLYEKYFIKSNDADDSYDRKSTYC